MVAPAFSGAFLIPFLGMYGGPSLLWEILTPYLEGVRWPQPSLRPFLPHVGCLVALTFSGAFLTPCLGRFFDGPSQSF